ncbi:MAG: cytochrome C assembly protein [Deinococcus-Thermus bacterium]|jgi:heme exporter protein C|nr:cytochrome C assembly protein [Deinococcota bacterium]
MTHASSRRPAWLTALAVVAATALAIGAYLGLVASPTDVNQGNLIRVMYAHVSVAWVSFLAVGVAALAGIAFLWRGRRVYDVISLAASETALLFGTLTIIGGMTYSKPTLNTFWTWDAKLTLTALMVALLAGVFIVRGLIDEPTRRGRVSAVILIVVLASLPLNYLAAEWFRTLHPAKAIDLTGGGITMDGRMLGTLLFNVVAAGLMFAWLLLERVRIGLREAEAETRQGAGDGGSGEVVRV